MLVVAFFLFFFSSRRRHTRWPRDWSSDVCSSDLLVALRAGDMGYLHVHAEGEDPGAGETSGPSIPFVAEAPTAGRYFLYLDFQIDGQVHTAQFVVEAEHGTGGESADAHPDRH